MLRSDSPAAVFGCRQSDFVASPVATDRRVILIAHDSWVLNKGSVVGFVIWADSSPGLPRAVKHNGTVVLFGDREVRNSMT